MPLQVGFGVSRPDTDTPGGLIIQMATEFCMAPPWILRSWGAARGGRPATHGYVWWWNEEKGEWERIDGKPPHAEVTAWAGPYATRPDPFHRDWRLVLSDENLRAIITRCTELDGTPYGWEDLPIQPFTRWARSNPIAKRLVCTGVLMDALYRGCPREDLNAVPDLFPERMGRLGTRPWAQLISCVGAGGRG